MISDESGKRKCQSRTAFEHQENKHHDYKIHNFNVDNEDTEIVKRFCSVINSNGDCRQEIKRRMRRRRAAMEESGKITKGKGMSLENKVKIIYTLIFPINYVQMRKSVKKLIRKKTDLSEIWWWRRILQIS